MKREFTKLMAALALLLFIAPLGMWGQEQTWTWTATSGALGTATSYDATLNGKAWHVNRNRVVYTGYTSSCIQLGSKDGAETVTLSSSAFEGTVKSVYVDCSSYNGAHKVAITVNGDTYLSSTNTASWTTVSSKGGTGISSGEIVISFTPGTRALYINKITVVTDNTPAYTITAQSNNLSLGTVSLSGNRITAAPASGCRYATPAYTVSPANSATVAQNGNEFTVTPSSNTTVTINFEAIPTHIATFSVNGTATSQSYAEGAPITFPATPANIDDKVFRGWTANAIEGTQSTAPEFVTSATMGTNDVAFYAVFATADASGAPVETLNQTLQYDTWTYSGSTTDKSTYRLFHTGSYIESVAFDLSKLSKVIVYGGTFGGTQYSNLIIGDGTNVWKDVTVTGKSETGTNTYTEGTALSGTKPLRIISNSGTASNSGIRISKVEIFTMEPSIAYTDYCTTVVVSSVATPAFTPATGTEFGSEGLTVTITCATENSTIYYTLDGTLPTNESIQYTVPFQLTTTTTVKAIAYVGTEASAVATATYNVVITNVYTAATSITPGKHYIIVGFADDDADFEQPYALGAQKNNNRNAVNVADYYDSEDDVLSIPSDVAVYELVISGDETNNYSIYDTENNGYLYTESSSNTLKNQATLDEAGKWTIARESDEYDNMIIGVNFNGTLRKMRFNYSETNPLFACYTTNGQKDIYLYEKAGDDDCHIYSATNIISNMTIEGDMNIHAGVVTVKEDAALTVNGTLTNETAANLVVEEGGQLVTSADVAGTMQKNVIGYGNNIEASNYYLITVPSTINPQNVEDMLNTNGYDLYYFNQSAEDDVEGENVLLEWRNYKDEPFSLEAGTGYLYANKENKTLNLTGTLKKNDNNETFAQDITYVDGFRFSGWNLVGNPFPSNAKVNMPFYKMNSDGDGINGTAMLANSVIAPMEGVFVIASAATTQVTFTATTDAVTTGANRSVKIDVNRDNQFLDRAIVDFNGSTLSKLNLSENATKVYFQQGQEEFAIVAAENEGELPVNFKASRNGRYTMSINVEDLDMNYLHLIDNKTGNDIDLLATPSYTFNANTGDNVNRFRLVFDATGIEENDTEANTTFAYFNGSEWVINNSGNATLQVIDMMGRVLSSETLNGNANVTLNQAAGVYMLRLVNGENVKVQKVVVR